MRQDNRQAQLVFCLLGILPVVWLGLLIAPAVGGGLPEIIVAFPAAMNDPTNGRMVIVAKLVVPSAEEVDADAGH